jgi:hypothetical protein
MWCELKYDEQPIREGVGLLSIGPATHANGRTPDTGLRPLHNFEQRLPHDLSYHFCHCGRRVQHISHTALLSGLVRVARKV